MIINIIIHIYPDEPIDLELFLFLLSLVLWHLSALELHSETRTKIIYSLKYRANIHCTCIYCLLETKNSKFIVNVFWFFLSLGC